MIQATRAELITVKEDLTFSHRHDRQGVLPTRLAAAAYRATKGQRMRQASGLHASVPARPRMACPDKAESA